ncbi:MAG TPA: hypothetical protein VFL12_06600, partial [Thermoanaerobaculia bacterium]|nr:hypothetical protein [Thermoanaerobaculia bacterium]
SGSLVARQFDTGKLRFIGEPEPVGESILQLGPNHLFDFGSAANIVTYQTVDPNLPFAWFDRSGKKISTIGEPGRYQRIEISPDGSHAAFEKLNLDGRNENIWSIDLVRGIAARLTTGPSSDYGPVWSRDGRTLWFSSTRDGMDHIYEVPVSRVADVREIKALKEATLDVWSSSPDGHLVYEAQQRDGKPDLWTLSPGSKRDAAPFRATSAGETEAQFSPDGKWVAFSSDDTGRQEVYVRSFADPSTEVQVSTDGGFRPRWRRDGRELFFWNKSATLTAVPVSTDSQFHAGAPVPLFSLPVWVDYDVAADGQRFLILTTAENAEPAGVAVVNWMEGLRKP